MNSEQLHVFFSYSEGIGPKTFVKLLEKFGSVNKLYFATRDELVDAGLKGKTLEKYLKFKSEFDLDSVLAQLEKKNIWILSYKDFPENFRNISNPPIVLFGRGNKSLILKKNKIGVVGSRRPTTYGISVTEELVSDLVDAGFVIVSGMALGIDGIAHRTALKSKGETVAVLGSGVDLPTPMEHSALYQQIINNNGAVVSEFPLGMIPNKGSFPARNRIISALSCAIIIPEATSDSGALITAKEAFSQGRKVFAVPGPITSSLSRGTNSLFSKGGIVVGSAEDVVRELGVKNYRLGKKIKNKIEHLNLSKEEAVVCRALENESLLIDELNKKVKIPIGELMTCLTGLELRNILKNSGGKWELKN